MAQLLMWKKPFPYLKDPSKQRNPVSFLLFLLVPFVLLAFLGPSFLLADGSTRDEIFAKYEEAVGLAEELNVYQEDIFHVIPKIRLAGQALLRQDFEQADRVLDEALTDLRIIDSKRPSQIQKALRLEWLEVYREVVQKYAVVALLAWLFIRIPYFRRMLKADHMTGMGRIYLTFVIGSCAIFFSFFDLARYGESAWAFLDIQVVFLTASGLLGGVWPGLFTGLVVGIFRWILKPQFFVYLAIAVGAGLLSGLFARFIKTYRRTGGISFGVGAFVGALHAAAIYLPMAGFLPWFYIVISILFLMVTEGVAVFIFFAVISGIIREESSRETERELLKTKLLFLTAQISPHFLYNALNTISAVCGRENATEARRLVLRLADFFRRTVKQYDDKVTLKEEMGYIDSYLEIEKARFQERLNVLKSFDLRDETWNAKIPFLMLQPLVENAIKHGISRREEGGTLHIRASEDAMHLRLEVEDDGVGADKEMIEDILNETSVSEETGIGLRNIHQRLIRFYGLRYGLKFDCERGKGIRVAFMIPLGEKKAGDDSK